MSVFASVDLPDPFGPISACVSPRFTVRSTPWRISRSSVRTCRFSIWSVMSDGCDLPKGLDQVVQRHLVQGSDDGPLDAGPQKLGGTGRGALAGTDQRAVGVRGDALDRRYVALERGHHLGHRDVRGPSGERVPAVRAPARLDQLGLA